MWPCSDFVTEVRLVTRKVQGSDRFMVKSDKVPQCLWMWTLRRSHTHPPSLRSEAVSKPRCSWWATRGLATARHAIFWNYCFPNLARNSAWEVRICRSYTTFRTCHFNDKTFSSTLIVVAGTYDSSVRTELDGRPQPVSTTTLVT